MMGVKGVIATKKEKILHAGKLEAKIFSEANGNEELINPRKYKNPFIRLWMNGLLIVLLGGADLKSSARGLPLLLCCGATQRLQFAG